MSVPGGGDITELLRRLGFDAIINEGERAGLKPRNRRMLCPWTGCQDKGPDRKDSAVVYADKGGKPRLGCFRCDQKGDLVDLLQRTRGWSVAEALAHVQGQQVPEKPRPALHVVANRPAEHPDKMLPAEVQRLWNSLALNDEQARAYLSKRNLEPAIDAGLVRFANAEHKDKLLSSRVRQGYVIAALLSDVVGQPRGIQLRLARKAQNSSEVTIVSVKGSVTSTAFFGEPGLIETTHLVAVAEGFADTTALKLWAEEHAVVVGGAGKGMLRHLSAELEAAGIDIEGKLFALFPQNDDPAELKKTSRAEFAQLRTELQRRGARVCWVKTPAEYADLADWLKAKPDTAWPPPELVEAFTKEPGDDQEPTTVLPRGMALPMPVRVETKSYAQNYTTLVHLIDDPSSRESIFHTRDQLTWCEMTGQPKVGGRELTEDDFSTVRLGLEAQARSSDNKPLQFKDTDIQKAIAYVARRNPVHEIRADVEAFAAWDNKPRLESEFPLLFGHAPGSFVGRLLRRWLVSAVARVMKPGCQVDTVLILTGGQGPGKTNFFRRLGGKWTTSSKVQPGDVEGMMVMRQFWFIEWGELSQMKSRSREETKDFITNSIDTFRWPWGRRPVSAPRHCIIVGTTNGKQMLEDPTGNRRYWPVEILTPDIDLQWVEENREQLFAEALAIYRAADTCPACAADRRNKRCEDHQWWLTKEEEELLKQHQQDFEVDPHPWFDVLHHWIEKTNPTSLTTAQVLQYGVDQKVEHFKPIGSDQIAQLMDRLGWKKTRDGRTGPRIWVRKEGLL
ncbi:MAG: virulence-associated E family protein [Archangium sp.]|nr:virulence-associated E family protein [Archangium sp.]